MGRLHKTDFSGFLEDDDTPMTNGEGTDSAVKRVVLGDGDLYKCFRCGRHMEEVFDQIAKKYTGHLWKCRTCNPHFTISIG